MSNSENGGCLMIITIIIYALAWIGSGTTAWSWVEPETFAGGIIFLVVWGILGYIAQAIGTLIIAGIIGMMGQ
jgi:hypothetical protein